MVNASTLLVAARVLHCSGPVAETLTAFHHGIGAALGPGAALAFAPALLASGLRPPGWETFAGQIIMRGFLHRSLRPVLRRLLTVAPPLGVLAAGVDPVHALIAGQVVLSFGIPFALVPLTVLTARRPVTGATADRPVTTAAAVTVTVLITALNGVLLTQLLTGGT